MKISALVDARKLSEYIRHRLNSDGGYTFARKLYGLEFPSSISETYYALAVLSMLGEEIPSKSKTLEYVKGIRKDDGRYGPSTTAFHAIKALLLLGEKPPADAALVAELQETIRQRRALFEEFDSVWFSADYDAGDSPFRSAFCAARVLKIVGGKMEKPDFVWMIHKEHEGGGFGIHKPDVASTYYVLSALASAGYDLKDYQKTSGFVERCSVHTGGYSQVERGAPAFVESTYFAVAALALLGKEPKEKEKHLHYLAGLQADGGFRRSTEIGISTLTNSYFAVKAISMLLNGGKNG